MKERFSRWLNKCMSVMIVVLVFVCAILLFKTITKNEVSIFGIRFYYIVTESMDPTIRPYSEIVVKETDAQKLEEGDIITFSSRDPAILGMPNTHRIVAIVTDENGQLAFRTMGDNNPGPDAYLVYPEDIYGRVIFHTFPIRILANLFSFVVTPVGFAVVIVLPLMLLFGIFMNSFIKECKSALEDEQNQTVQVDEQARMILEEFLKETGADEQPPDTGKEEKDGGEQTDGAGFDQDEGTEEKAE